MRAVRLCLTLLAAALLPVFGSSAQAQNLLLGVGPAYQVGSLLTAPITLIDPAGWSAECPTCTTPSPDTTPAYLTVTHAGYDATGTWSASAYTENYVATRLIRQPYPASTGNGTGTGSLGSCPVCTTTLVTPAQVAMSEYTYATDTLPAGVTNNSTVTSPPPICTWTMEQRLVVGGTIHVEVFCAHRNARSNREVAAVIFTATDGTNPITPVTVSAMTQSTANTGDQHIEQVYQADLPVSGLSDNSVTTVNAKVYPFAGGSSALDTTSIADSSTATDHLAFSPRYFYRSTARAANWPRAYVDASGSDTTGQWQTPGNGAETDAIAAAHPFLTIGGAINAISSTTGSSSAGTNRGISATSGGLAAYYSDGAVLYVRSGTFAFTSPTVAQNQYCGALTLTRDPAVARTAAIITLGNTRASLDNNNACGGSTPAPAMRFVDVTISVPSTTALLKASASKATSQVDVVNSTIDLTSNPHSLGCYGECHIFGATIINGVPSSSTSTFFVDSGLNRWGMMRGLSVADIGQQTISAMSLHASNIGDPGLIDSRITTTLGTAADRNGSGVAFTRFDKVSYLSNVLYAGGGSGGGTMTGYYNIEIVGDIVGPTPAFERISGDEPTDTGSTSHVVVQFVTAGGVCVYGRSNSFYDNSPGVLRSHLLTSIVGVIAPEIEIKLDLFCATLSSPSCPSPGSHVGNFPVYYGAGLVGVFTGYAVNPIDPDSIPEHGTAEHAYWGLHHSQPPLVGPTNHNDPLFVDYEGVTGTSGYAVTDCSANGYTPATLTGTGNSNLHLQTVALGYAANSPAIGLVPNSPLPFDLDGVARGLVTASGAYAASANH